MSSSDLFAYVRPSDITVSCFGRSWQLYPHTAYEWLGVLGYDLETLTGVVPGAVMDSDAEAMYELSLLHDDADSRWQHAARAAVGRAGGRDWWWTVNLSRKALSGWPYINGRLLLEGVVARHLPFPDWLDAAYMLLWNNTDETGRMKLDLELSLMPKGVPITQTPAQKLKMMEDFAAD